MKHTLFFTLILFSCALPAQEIYSWIDKNGVTKFSDKMPRNISAERVRKMNVNQSSSYKTVNQIAKKAGKSTSQQQQELEQLSQKTCLGATKNLKILTAFDQITQVDKNGKEQILTEQQKAKQISLVNKQIEIFCPRQTKVTTD